jgi:hypothetical protein
VIVVDTSVWIDVLNDRDSPQALRCVALIEGGEPIALTELESVRRRLVTSSTWTMWRA